MGGCHCSYRNCSVRSDGVTHMFHFPVWDKVRCHQWLVNAGRLEFLNLKVSQLKNRVVCQHHFEANDFMNFKNEKLKFNAVPKIDGPFCEPKTFVENITQEDVSAYDISLEDIENEMLSLNEKKANFSVKYGDFLTNGYSMNDPLNLLKTRKKENNVNTIVPDVFFDFEPAREEKNFHIDFSKNNMLLVKSQPLESQSNKKRNSLVSIPTALKNAQKIESFQNQYKNESSINIQKNQSVNKQSIKNNNNKVCIVSEKTITNSSYLGNEPIVLGKLEPVHPSIILQFPRRHQQKPTTNNNISTSDLNDTNVNSCFKEENIKSDQVDSKYQIANEIQFNYELPITTTEQPTSTGCQLPESLNNIGINVEPISNNDETKILQKSTNTIQSTNCNVKNLQNKEKSPSASLLKTKMAPERVAIIEKKRKFNMKLRDMVESCLDKIEMQDKVSNVSAARKKLKIKQSETQTVESFSSLESRLKRMEENLLSKIEQNSQNISHLRSTIILETKKRTMYTQTSNNEETHKKFLYQEISKFLSPDANNLVYEELFINKYAQKHTDPKDSTPTRRTTRRCR